MSLNLLRDGAACAVTTSAETMLIPTPEIVYNSKQPQQTDSDAECFAICRNYYRINRTTGIERRCGASVRNSTTGLCYLHTEGIEDAVPTTNKTYVTYCTEPAPTIVTEDATKEADLPKANPMGANVDFVVTVTGRATTSFSCSKEGGAPGSGNPGERFEIGVTKVTCVGVDGNGTETAPIVNTITVTKTPAPTIVTEDVTKEANLPKGSPTGAKVDFVVTVTGVGTTSFSCSKEGGAPGSGNPGKRFALGVTEVTCVGVDGNGMETAPVVNIITVTKPAVPAPTIVTEDVTKEADLPKANPTGANVNFTVTVTGTGTTSFSCSKEGGPPGSGNPDERFDIGVTEVTCVGVDGDGTETAPAVNTITVTKPTAPTIKTGDVTKVAYNLTAVDVNFWVTVTGTGTLSFSCTKEGGAPGSGNPGKVFAIGVTKVTCVGIDGTGTESAPVVNTITVIKPAYPECIRTTTKETMTIRSRALYLARSSGSALQCFQLCLDWDKEGVKCTATVHHPRTGDCFLHAQTIFDAVPATKRTFVTYCATDQCETVKLWGKCGGKSAGVFAKCEAGSICVRKNNWYYQCRPSKSARPGLPYSRSAPLGWDGTRFPLCVAPNQRS